MPDSELYTNKQLAPCLEQSLFYHTNIISDIATRDVNEFVSLIWSNEGSTKNIGWDVILDRG